MALDHLASPAQGWNQRVQEPGSGPTVAAQAVQRSAHPDAYARWEPTATALVHALAQPDTPFAVCGLDDPPTPTGADPPGPLQPQAMGADGLTPRTRRVRDLAIADFDVHDIGGYCPGGCTSGHIRGSDHYTGHAIDIMLAPITPTRQALGNRIATWAAANARPLAIKYVIWNAQIWAATRAREGWRPYRHPSGHTNPTLEHRDHVHISVY